MNILIIINPASGRGNSLDIYYQNFNKISSNYNITEFISRYPKHVDDYFKNNYETLKDFNIIVGMGGDGIMFEILNNIKKFNLEIYLAEIPTGSGNGYFKSLTCSNNKEPTIEEAINIINKYNIIDVDLLEIKNLNIYCRLAISWGIISNIDIDTEWMRCLGKYRFDIGGVWNVITCPSYNGILLYVKDNVTNIIEGNFCFVWAGNNSHASTDTHSFPGARINDGKICISYVMDDVTRYEITMILLGLNDGSYINHPKVHYIYVDNFELKIKDGKIVVDGEFIKEKEIKVTNKQKELKILGYKY